MWQKIKALKEERAELMAGMKAILKKSEDEKRDLTPEENALFDEKNTKAEQRKADIDRYERAQALEAELAKKTDEQRIGRDELNTPEAEAEKKKGEVRKAFDHFLRHGRDGNETRALTVSGTGVVGDRPFYDQLVIGLKAYAGVRNAGATILPTSDGNPFTVPSMTDTSNTGVLVAENATSNTQTDAVTGNITLNGWKFDSKWMLVSLELLQDAAYPVEATITNMAAERIGRAFNTYSTTGTGSGQPLGFVTAAPVGKVTAANNAFTYEELVDFIHSLDAAYRNQPGKCFVQFHDTTLAAIRKMKNAAGMYIWNAGAAGAPANILDFPYVVNNDMAKLTDGVNSVVAAFGDFSRYFVRDVTTPIVVRADELFIGQGCIGYKVFSRHDGNLADTNAVKLLKLAAT